jgi:hypothetical protein
MIRNSCTQRFNRREDADNLKTLNLRSMTMNARELVHGGSHMPIARSQIPGYRDEEIGPLLTLTAR